MSASRRLAGCLGGLAALTGAGTLGYVYIEGFSWSDAFYMTVITLSTVGFGEVQPLGPAGRLFTSGLIIVGVGTALYLLTTLAQILIDGNLRDSFQRRAMRHHIARISGHVIVCGYGRFGRAVIDEIGTDQRPLVVIECDPAREPDLRRLSCPYVLGSALEDDVLREAGVERAQELVACTSSDSDNLFITLAARELHPEIRVHARAESEASYRRLKRAGATQIISSYQIGAQRIATSILRPSVVDFLEISRPHRGSPVDLEEVRVGAHSALAGQTIQQAEGPGARLRIVAVKRGTHPIELVPRADEAIRGGDHLIVIGERSALDQLSQLASAEASA